MLSFASLFSGCGGFDLGFLSRKFKSLGAFDIDSDAVANFRENVSPAVAQTDLTRELPNLETIRKVDVLIAGPPCQGFSTAGKRDVDDKRNHLLPLVAELALKIKPRVLVVENVAGALSGAHAKYIKKLESSMRQAGYRTHMLTCQVSSLGMAQQRRRVLFFAWNTGSEIEFIARESPPSTLEQVLDGVELEKNHSPRHLQAESREWRIARRIKPGQKLSNVRGGPSAIATWEIPEVFGKITANERKLLELLRQLRRQERCRTYGDADPVSMQRIEQNGNMLVPFVDTLIQKGYLRKLGNYVDLVGTYNGKYRRLCWEKPSLTVDTRFGSHRYFLHPTEHRGFTVREAARIQGFPDSYHFVGSDSTLFRLIGNAVPPPLGRLAADWARVLISGAL